MAALNPNSTIRFNPTKVKYVVFRRKDDFNGKLGFEYQGKKIWMTSAVIDGEIKNICSTIQLDENWNVQSKIDENFTEEDLDKYEVTGFSRKYIIENIIPLYKPKESILKCIDKLSNDELSFLIKDIFSTNKDNSEIMKLFENINSKDFVPGVEHKQIMNILMIHQRELFSELVNFIIEIFIERINNKKIDFLF